MFGLNPRGGGTGGAGGTGGDGGDGGAGGDGDGDGEGDGDGGGFGPASRMHDESLPDMLFCLALRWHAFWWSCQ